MGKVSNPVSLSSHFGLSPTKLDALGVLDSTLAIDTKLFIDPFLFEKSTHKEMRVAASALYRERFEKIIDLLNAVQREDDPAWKAAYKLFHFPEVPGLCLGYGAATIRGSGWGKALRTRALRVASEIIRIGGKDPDLFPALALFEEDIGPDRIGDMTANIVISALAQFNQRILKKLKISGESFKVAGADYVFLKNPFESERTPIILVPTDVLRELPIASDWDEVATVADANDELRERANQHIASIWMAKAKREKSALKEEVLRSKDAVDTLLDILHASPGESYDTQRDPNNLVAWSRIGAEFAAGNAIKTPITNPSTPEEVVNVVKAIIDQFAHLVENAGLNKELYVRKSVPRHENSAQRIFFAVAYAYCKANNVDVSPEIDTGNGKLDFKFSRGFTTRVLVEIKLSTNSSTVPGYTKQLDVYKDAQETSAAFYVVIDVGKMGYKQEDLIDTKNELSKTGQRVSELVFIDGIVKPTASKRKLKLGPHRRSGKGAARRAQESE